MAQPMRSTIHSLQFRAGRFPRSWFQVRGTATFTDANPGASGPPVKRWVLEISLRSGSLPITHTKFLRSRCALWTGAPHWMRFCLCIGCDPAALQPGKETPCPTQRNPQPASTSTRSPLPSGGTRTRRASSTPSLSSAATATTPESGRPLRPSTRMTCLRFRNSPTLRHEDQRTSRRRQQASRGRRGIARAASRGRALSRASCPLLFSPTTERTASRRMRAI